MKKIVVITLQRVPNYGSVLQAYATSKIIESLGYDVEFINYMPKRMTIVGMLINLKNKNKVLKKSILIRTIVRMIMLPSYLIRFKTFNKFTKARLKMTSEIYHSFDELKKNIPKADIYLTGSDQVWNSDWNGEIDKSLFLDFVPDNTECISFASSFGKSKLDDNEKKETKKLLKKYKKLSVRELSGKEILKKLGFNAEVVLDPTLLLNFQDWNKLASKKYNKKNYIFVYNLNRNKNIDFYARILSKKMKLPIYNISYTLHEFYKTGKNKCSIPVEDFLSLVKNATYVITDSFHATAFSINFNVDFMIILPQKFSSRLESILDILDLKDRIVTDKTNLSLADKKIDYKKVNQKLEKERERSLNWLKKALTSR